jgi:hypothetical protein
MSDRFKQRRSFMNVTQRPYNSESDLPAILALKQICTIPQTLYDRPTTSDLRRLLAPVPGPVMTTKPEPAWEETLRGMSPEHRHRVLTQRLTALWEDARGQLVAYALNAQPGSSLTFQVHPEAQGRGIEARDPGLGTGTDATHRAGPWYPV